MSNSKKTTRVAPLLASLATTMVAPLASLVTFSALLVYFLRWRGSPFDAVLLDSSSKLNTGSRILLLAEAEKEDDSMEFRMRRLITGQNRARFRATGFTCQPNQQLSEQCITTNEVRIQNNPDDGITIYISSSTTRRIIKPYTPQHDDETFHYNPMRIQEGNLTGTTLPTCHYNHTALAVVFSTGVRLTTGNMYQELDRLLVPLFLTTKHFKSDIQFYVTDNKLPFAIRNKYRHFITGLSKFEPIYSSSKFGTSSTTHCFPGAVIGLNYHGKAAVNSSAVPLGYTMVDFRRFMYQSFNLNNPYDFDTTKPTTLKPVLVLISRAKSRVLLNQDQLVTLMEEVGFQVHVAPEKETSDLNYFSRVLSACDVLVGVHGAGLSNAVFMPDGGVVVQLVGLGLQQSAMYHYGDPAISMGLRHVEYLIEPEESSLLEIYGPNAPEIVHPESVFGQRYNIKASQNVTVNLNRFRETLVQVWQSIT